MNKMEKVLLGLDRAMAFSFYALIFFLPISIALVEWFTSLPIVFYLLKRLLIWASQARGKKPSFRQEVNVLFQCLKPVDNFLNKPVAIFIFVNFLSIFFSQYPHLSWKGFLGKVLQTAFIYFTFAECINSPKRLKNLLSVFMVSLLLIGANGIFQYFAGYGFIFWNPIAEGRITSTFRASNDFGGYLVLSIPIAAALVLCHFKYSLKLFGKQASGYVQSLALIFAFVCLGLSFSRGAWLGVILALVVFSLHSRKFLAAMIAFSVVFVLFSSVLMLKKRQYIVGNNKQILIFNTSGREEFWRQALVMVKDHPVLGTGVNTYSLAVKKYNLTWSGYPHNCYLQMAIETGLVGLGSFLFFLYTLFKAGINFYRNSQDRFSRWVVWGALSGLAGFLLHSFFDTLFYSVQLSSLMWVAFSLIGVISGQGVGQSLRPK